MRPAQEDYRYAAQQAWERVGKDAASRLAIENAAWTILSWQFAADTIDDRLVKYFVICTYPQSA